VRALLHRRPRSAALRDAHLEAHLQPLRLAGAARLATGAAERIYEDGVALARELGSLAWVPRIELAFAEYQLLRGLARASTVHAGRALELADAGEDARLVARAEAALFSGAFWLGRGDDRTLRRRLAALAGESGQVRGILLRRLAWASAMRGERDRATEECEQAIAALRGSDLEARTRVEAAYLGWLAGDLECADDTARAAVEVVPIPDWEGARRAALAVRGLIALECGRPRDALDALDEALRRGEQSGVTESWCIPVGALTAEAHALLGDFEAAHRALRDFRSATGPLEPESAARTYHVARALQRTGVVSQARDMLATTADAAPLATCLAARRAALAAELDAT